MKNQLKPHQQKAVKTSPDKWCILFKMRCGKTPTAIKLIEERATNGLIISPKSVVSHWHNEIETWNSSDKKIDVISRETFRRDAHKLQKYEAIVVDEVHQHFSNYKNQAYKSLEKYIKKHNPKYIWLLTGTPVPSTSWAVYSYGKLLGKNWEWYQWDQRFFTRVKMGRRMIPIPNKKRNPELLQILKNIGTVISLKDIVDIEDDYNVIEKFSLNKKQKDLIKEYFDPLPIVRYTRQHQIEQATLKSDGYREDISFLCDKDKRLIDLVKNTEKVIIVCRYHVQINKYETMLGGLKRNIYKISGQEKKSSSEIAPEAENDDTAIVLVQSGTCVGYSLKSFNTMIFASMDFSFVNYEQMRERMKSMDKTNACEYIHLLTEGDSLDKAVYDCVQIKCDFDVNLYKK